MNQNLIASQPFRYIDADKSEIFDTADKNKQSMSPEEFEFWGSWCIGFFSKRDDEGTLSRPGLVLKEELPEGDVENLVEQFLAGKNPYIWIFAAKQKFRKAVRVARAGATLRDYAWHTGVSIFDAPKSSLSNDYEAISDAGRAETLVIVDLHGGLRPTYLPLLGQMIAERVESRKFTVAVSRAAVRESGLGGHLGIAYMDAVTDENCSVITL